MKAPWAAIDDMENAIDSVKAFTADNEPFDEEFGVPCFSLYGLGKDGLLKHIADRATYSAAIKLACKLAPGINFKHIRFSQGSDCAGSFP